MQSERKKRKKKTLNIKAINSGTATVTCKCVPLCIPFPPRSGFASLFGDHPATKYSKNTNANFIIL